MNTVELARRMFDAGDSYWAAVLWGGLRLKDEPLAYEWVESCVRKLLSVVTTENKRELVADLNVLSYLRGRGAGQAEFCDLSQQIWYRSNRDQAQTAMSKLFWAAGCEAGV